jgi:hypothetical protein
MTDVPRNLHVSEDVSQKPVVDTKVSEASEISLNLIIAMFGFIGLMGARSLVIPFSTIVVDVFARILIPK